MRRKSGNVFGLMRFIVWYAVGVGTLLLVVPQFGPALDSMLDGLNPWFKWSGLAVLFAVTTGLEFPRNKR